jgi:hypothetical protein
MSCEICIAAEATLNPDAIHVIRRCDACGGDYKTAPDPGAHGIGIQIKKGDQLVMPSAALKITANPLKSGGTFSRYGIGWFANLVFLAGGFPNITSQPELLEFLEKSCDSARALIATSEKFAGLDLETQAGTDAAFDRLKDDKESLEWFGLCSAALYAMAHQSITGGDVTNAVAFAMSAERMRALATFRTEFEEVVFMGQSARRLIELLQVWDANKTNSDEKFWQLTLKAHSYSLSQLFAAPVTFIEGNAYVGGQRIDRSNARYLDFLLSGGNANQAILVEIKTPVARLLGSKYRENVYPPSKDLGGAIIQVNDYCDKLRLQMMAEPISIKIHTFNPRRLVLIGNYLELANDAQRSSFELFRSSLSGVEIVTFDEFFKKLEELAKLFNLVRK